MGVFLDFAGLRGGRFLPDGRAVPALAPLAPGRSLAGFRWTRRPPFGKLPPQPNAPPQEDHVARSSPAPKGRIGGPARPRSSCGPAAERLYWSVRVMVRRYVENP